MKRLCGAAQAGLSVASEVPLGSLAPGYNLQVLECCHGQQVQRQGELVVFFGCLLENRSVASGGLAGQQQSRIVPRSVCSNRRRVCPAGSC